MILRIRRSLQIRGAAKEERHKTKKKAAVNVRRVEKSQHSSLVICNVQASSRMCRVRSMVFRHSECSGTQKYKDKCYLRFIEAVKCWGSGGRSRLFMESKNGGAFVHFPTFVHIKIQAIQNSKGCLKWHFKNSNDVSRVENSKTDGSMIAADLAGNIKVWKYPGYKQVCSFEQHHISSVQKKQW